MDEEIVATEAWTYLLQKLKGVTSFNIQTKVAYAWSLGQTLKKKKKLTLFSAIPHCYNLQRIFVRSWYYQRAMRVVRALFQWKSLVKRLLGGTQSDSPFSYLFFFFSFFLFPFFPSFWQKELKKCNIKSWVPFI